MDFDLVFKNLVERTGAAGCILMGFDGISVADYIDPNARFDLELLGAEVTGVINQLRSLAISEDIGVSNTLITESELYQVVYEVISEEYYLALILPTSQFIGKARFILSQVRDDLRAEVI